MDLKVYYQKLRGTEAGIEEEFPVIVSNETEDGGKKGRYAEVTRANAARMITEGSARLAMADEAKAYRQAQAAAKKAADDAAEASKVQFTVVSTSEMTKLAASKKEKA
jgi:hypothetical protein